MQKHLHDLYFVSKLIRFLRKEMQDMIGIASGTGAYRVFQTAWGRETTDAEYGREREIQVQMIGE